MRPLSYPKLTPSHCLTQSFYLTPLDLRLLIYTRILVLLIPEVHSNRDTLWSVLDTYICESMNGETVETVSDFIFWAPKSLQMVTAAMKLKDAYSLEGKL